MIVFLATPIFKKIGAGDTDQLIKATRLTGLRPGGGVDAQVGLRGEIKYEDEANGQLRSRGAT
jgi:hypothetical protein